MSTYVANLEIYPRKLRFIRDRVLITQSSFDCFIPAVRSRMCFWCRSWETDPAISSAVNGYDGSVEIVYIQVYSMKARSKLETNHRGNKKFPT